MYGLLGQRLNHSLSPQIHSYFGDYDYSLFCREKNELDEFFNDKKINAFNVTIPYKVEAYNRCDFLSETAKEIGSVNTVVRKDGKLFGYNTDLFGFEYLCRKTDTDFEGKKVLILGSGGASKTVIAAAKKHRAKEIVIVSRSGENNYTNIYKNFDAQIIVNTTPVGMFPDNGKSPVNLSDFKNVQSVLDLIYNPLKTQLLIDAESLGISSGNGLYMLIAQGLRSSEIFFDRKYDYSIIDNVYSKLLNEKRNIVLIGMPGCGKSTVGKIIAQKLGKSFADTDEKSAQICSKKISEIFEENGEDFFRNLEEKVCADIGKNLGFVIATGGGSVLRKSNRNALGQNAVVVYLKKDLLKLARFDRPLSRDYETVKKLYAQRKEIYESFADHEIEVDENPQITAERVIKCVSL